MPAAAPSRRLPRHIAKVAVLAAIVLLTGCDAAPTFADAIDLELDFRAQPDDDADALHSPYVVGTHTRAIARAPFDLSGHTLASSNPSVLEVAASDGDGGRIAADIHAIAAGHAELRLVDGDGEVVAHTEIEVRTPSRVVLHAAAPLFLGRDDLHTEALDARVLRDGVATFAVDYYDGATRLHGGAALSIAGDEPVEAHALTSWQGEPRDWLQLSPRVAGLHELTLAADGQAFTRVQIHAVEADAIADLELRGRDRGAVRRGDDVLVIAQAYDDDGDPVFGAACAWELAGKPDGEPGELYRRAWSRAAGKPLAASFGELRSEATIDAARGELEPTGCSVRDRATPSNLLLLAVVAIARRRRSPHGG